MIANKTLLDGLATATAALCLAPVAAYLDPPLLLLALGALLGGFWSDRTGRYLLPPLPATLLALAGIAAYAVRVSRADVATPVIHALVVLLAVRLLTAKQPRDYLQIFMLALFVLAGSSLLSLEIGFLGYLVLLVFAVTIGLLLLTVHVTAPALVLTSSDLRKLLRVALLMPAASLLLMLGFFAILPRTAHPLWNFLNPAGKAVAGLAESVQPGSFAQLSAARSLAFRAEGPELPPEQRYWRALVLNAPQGSRWVREEPPGEGSPRLEGGRPVTFTLYPEPRSDRLLVTLERPLQVSGVRLQGSADQVYRTSSVIDHRIRYSVQARPDANLRIIGRVARDFYLRAPTPVSARVAAAAQRIAASGADSTTRLAAMAEFFREQRLVYARDNLPGGPDPVDAFLFEKKRGYCEFFATAYVTVARLAGLPARLVGGYYGGEYNALGGYYLVTDDTAHLWAEVLSDDGRWLHVDPSQWASNAAEALGAGRGERLGRLQRLGDALDYYWVQAVVVFDLGRQVELYNEVRRTWRDWRRDLWRGASWWWPVAIGVFGALAWSGRWLARDRLNRERRLLARLRARVRRRHGASLAAESLGLSELAERLDSEPCREFARIWHAALFSDRPLTAGEMRRLKQLIRDL